MQPLLVIQAKHKYQLSCHLRISPVPRLKASTLNSKAPASNKSLAYTPLVPKSACCAGILGLGLSLAACGCSDGPDPDPNPFHS